MPRALSKELGLGKPLVIFFFSLELLARTTQFQIWQERAVNRAQTSEQTRLSRRSRIRGSSGLCGLDCGDSARTSAAGLGFPCPDLILNSQLVQVNSFIFCDCSSEGFDPAVTKPPGGAPADSCQGWPMPAAVRFRGSAETRSPPEHAERSRCASGTAAVSPG